MYLKCPAVAAVTSTVREWVRGRGWEGGWGAPPEEARNLTGGEPFVVEVVVVEVVSGGGEAEEKWFKRGLCLERFEGGAGGGWFLGL